MTHRYNCGAQQQAPYLWSSICKKFSCRTITTNEQQMKQVSHMVGVTHSWPVLLRLGPNMVLWMMDLSVHLGEVRLFLILCVTHARWRSLAVHRSEGNTSIFRDRLTSWGKSWKNGGSQTCLQLPLRDERSFGRALGEGRLCPVVLSLPLLLSWVCQLCAAAVLPCDNLFGAPPPSGSCRCKRLEVYQHF